MAIIALMSDFGTRDWFVAEMKGVILSIAPQATIIDITHDIPPGDLRSATFILYAVFKKFPRDTIFCQNVDPGAQSNCPIIIAQFSGYTFIAPDNGSISWVFRNATPDSIYSCIPGQFHLPEHSTFRGRDNITPVAAHFSNGIRPERFGAVINDYVSIPFPDAKVNSNCIKTEIIYIDHFGNIITSIENQSLENLKHKKVSLTINHKEIKIPIADEYYEISNGSVLLYSGSVGFAEIAVNGGCAAEYFNACAGNKIDIVMQ